MSCFELVDCIVEYYCEHDCCCSGEAHAAAVEHGLWGHQIIVRPFTVVVETCRHLFHLTDEIVAEDFVESRPEAEVTGLGLLCWYVRLVFLCVPHEAVAPNRSQDEVVVGLVDLYDADLVQGGHARFLGVHELYGLGPPVWGKTMLDRKGALCDEKVCEVIVRHERFVVAEVPA